MSSTITFQALPILIDGQDTQAQLVLSNGQLVGVLARLDGETHDPENKGSWHLEAGFGPCSSIKQHLFKSLEGAEAWVQGRLAGSVQRLDAA